MEAKLKTQLVDTWTEAQELMKTLNDMVYEHTCVQHGDRFFVAWALLGLR